MTVGLFDAMPHPDFLWVYPLVLVASTAASLVVDGEGHWTETGASVTVMGYVTSPDDKTYRMVDYRYGSRNQVDAVALVPLGTSVAADDLLIVPDGIALTQSGRYKILVVRSNFSHLRLLVERFDILPTEHVP